MKIFSTLRSQFVVLVAAAVIVSNLAVAITLEIAREGELRGARVAFVVDRVSALFDLVSTLSMDGVRPTDLALDAGWLEP